MVSALWYVNVLRVSTVLYSSNKPSSGEEAKNITVGNK